MANVSATGDRQPSCSPGSESEADTSAPWPFVSGDATVAVVHMPMDTQAPTQPEADIGVGIADGVRRMLKRHRSDDSEYYEQKRLCARQVMETEGDRLRAELSEQQLSECLDKVADVPEKLLPQVVEAQIELFRKGNRRMLTHIELAQAAQSPGRGHRAASPSPSTVRKFRSGPGSPLSQVAGQVERLLVRRESDDSDWGREKAGAAKLWLDEFEDQCPTQAD